MVTHLDVSFGTVRDFHACDDHVFLLIEVNRHLNLYKTLFSVYGGDVLVVEGEVFNEAVAADVHAA